MSASLYGYMRKGAAGNMLVFEGDEGLLDRFRQGMAERALQGFIYLGSGLYHTGFSKPRARAATKAGGPGIAMECRVKHVYQHSLDVAPRFSLRG